MFHVTGIGLPPVEPAADTRRYFGVTNPFGGSPVNGPPAATDERMTRLINSSPVRRRVRSSIFTLVNTLCIFVGCDARYVR